MTKIDGHHVLAQALMHRAQTLTDAQRYGLVLLGMQRLIELAPAGQEWMYLENQLELLGSLT